jgi:hypothetical protein
VITTPAIASGAPTDAIHDTAYLVGGPATYGGTLTFRVYSSLDNCNTNTSGTVVGSAKTVTGDGTYQSDNLHTPISPGNYFWRVFYSGDGTTGVPSKASTCDSQTEESVITNNTACQGIYLVGARGTGENSNDYAGFGRTVAFAISAFRMPRSPVPR